MNIRNGDLLWRRTEDSPLASHYGIAVHLPNGLHVMHRQRANGGVVEPLDRFLLGYPLRGSRPTKLTDTDTPDLLARFYAMQAGEFNIVTNNCEQWAYRYLGELPTFTDTDLRVLAGIGIITFIIYRL